MASIPEVNTGEDPVEGVQSNKREIKSSAQLCTDWEISNVDVRYTEVDFVNLTSYKLFCQHVRPVIAAKHPRLSKSKVMSLIAAKWREFCEMKEKGNVLAAQESEAGDDEISSTGHVADNENEEEEDVAEEPDKLSSTVVPDDSDEEAQQNNVDDPSSNKQVDQPGATQKSRRASARRSTVTGSKVKTASVTNGATGAGSSIAQGASGGEQRRSSRRVRHKKSTQRHADSDEEFEALLRIEEGRGSDESLNFAPKPKKPKKVVNSKPSTLQRLNRPVAAPMDGNETDHQDFCEACGQGGEILLCDTCPRAFHLVCVDPDADQTPDGDWYCPVCVKDGVPTEPRIVQQDDHHMENCKVCKDGGELLCCDRCVNSYHMHCMYPPVTKVPEGEWKCPRCCVIRPQVSVKKILGWRWRLMHAIAPLKSEPKAKQESVTAEQTKQQVPVELEDVEMKEEEGVVEEEKIGDDQTVKSEIKEDMDVDVADEDMAADNEEEDFMEPYGFVVEPNRVDKEIGQVYVKELFVKYDCLSYWHCEWIPEIVLEIHQSILWRCFWKRHSEMQIATFTGQELDDQVGGGGGGEGRVNRKLDKDLDRRYYSNGIKPEWLAVHRIITHKKDRSGNMFYLVKWRDLGYDQATYEPENGDYSGEIRDWRKHVEEYSKVRKRLESQYKIRNKSKHSDMSSDGSELAIDPRKKLEKQPDYVDALGGTLHDYQLEGLNWLRFSWAQSTDVILADEMGLGKTVQTITFLYSLFRENLCHGPFLISAPLSTIINWDREFETWAPDMYIVTYTGDRDSRATIRQHEFCMDDDSIRGGTKACKMKSGARVKFNVLLTSYELISVDAACLCSIDWEVLVVDEAHRLKNNQSKFFRTLSEFNIKRKVLLTGTPLQNNLEELYHLLNFLSPENFHDMPGFLSEFSDISKDNQVKKLHDMLGPHLLRRLKTDVLRNMPTKSEFIVRVEPSPMQKKYYQYIIHRNYEVLSIKAGGAQTSLLNVVMELKKCCNHPYLMAAAAEDAPLTKNGQYEGLAMTKACGKLELLSEMLPKLNKDGHRVLIFSQMTRMMDILEDFLDHMGYKYERIDGKITGQERQDAIDRFNAPGADQFVFLLSTRSGGLGINLATADTVVIYDSDWNPHNDIQAFSRAHRIGQQNKVMIYRFVTRDTVEERICQVAKRKMMLTHLIVRPGVGRGGQNMSKKELEDILRFGTENLFKGTDKKEDEEEEKCQIHYDDEAIERLLDRSQKGIEEKECGLNEYLSSFKVASYLVKDEVEPEEVPEKDDEFDGAYWERLIGHQHLQLIEEESRNFGKGKRSRRQVNYAVPSNDENWNEQTSEYNSDNSPQSANDEEDEDIDFDDKNECKRRRLARDKQLPPLINKLNGGIEILGFNARQRKSFLNAVMRYGPPTFEVFASQWMVRDLRQKSEKEFRAYTSLFMRHLCETSETSDCFLDGVPKEGISRQQVLSRIGVLGLIRRKVHEFETLNGIWSLPETMPDEHGILSDQVREICLSDTNHNTPEKAALSTEATAIEQPVADAGTRTLEPGEIPIESKSQLKRLNIKFNIIDAGFTEIHTQWAGEDIIINQAPKTLQARTERDLWNRCHDYWLLVGLVTHGYGRWQDIQSDQRFGLINEPFKQSSNQYNFLEVKNKFLARRYKLIEQALIVEEQLRRACYLMETTAQKLPDVAGPPMTVNLMDRYSELESVAEAHQHLAEESVIIEGTNGKSAHIILQKVFSQLEELLVEMKTETNKLPPALAKMAPTVDRLHMSEKSLLGSLLEKIGHQSTHQASGSSSDNTDTTKPATDTTVTSSPHLNPYLSYPIDKNAFAFPVKDSHGSNLASVVAANQAKQQWKQKPTASDVVVID